MISFQGFLTEGPPKALTHTVRVTKDWDRVKNGLKEDDPLRQHIDNIEGLLQRKPWAGAKPQRGQPISDDQYAWQSRYNAHTIEQSETPAAKRILSSLKPGEKWIQGHFPGVPGLPSGRYVWGAVVGTNKDGSTYAEARHIVPHDKAAN